MADCPRCKLSMQAQEYEQITVLFCDNCWGHWLDDASLKRILDTHDYGFSRDERETVFKNWVDAGLTDVEGSQLRLRCPVCAREMAEDSFADDCPVLVDRCDSHGTWLDAGEIKQLQVFVESR